MAQTFNSNEYANRVAVPPKANSKNKFGKVYRAYFSFQTAAAGLAIGDDWNLCVLPAGARIVGGHLTHDAQAATTATVAIGVAGATGKYLAAVAVGASEGNIDFAKTITQNFGDELTAETTIKLTNAVAAFDVDDAWAGYIEFIF